MVDLHWKRFFPGYSKMPEEVKALYAQLEALRQEAETHCNRLDKSTADVAEIPRKAASG